MNKIRILAILSIDGFFVPQKWQRSFGFDASQYEHFCRDADAVLTDKSEYKNLREIELNCGIPVYAIQKDCSLVRNGESRSLIIDQLENEDKKTIVVVGNNRRLTSALLNKACANEIVICLFPLILGKGKRPFPALPEHLVWKVKNRQLYDIGITALFYIRKQE